MTKVTLYIRYYLMSKGFALCLFISVLLAVSSYATAQCSQEFDPAALLDQPIEKVSSLVKPAMKAERLSLNQKQIQTISNIASNIAEEKNQDSSFNILLAKGPTTPQTQQLWKARITAPDSSGSIQSKTQLQQMIAQVNSIEFKPQKQIEPEIVAEKSESDPNQQEKTIIVTETSMVKTIIHENKSGHQQLTSETLEILKDMSQHPEKIENPFELAEILFNAGCLNEAAICYQQALLRMTNQSQNDPDKAWILFQIGNCLRNSDLQKALESYRKLVDEFPDSQWSEMAKAQCTLINWFLENNIDAMLKHSKK